MLQSLGGVAKFNFVLQETIYSCKQQQRYVDSPIFLRWNTCNREVANEKQKEIATKKKKEEKNKIKQAKRKNTTKEKLCCCQHVMRLLQQKEN